MIPPRDKLAQDARRDCYSVNLLLLIWFRVVLHNHTISHSGHPNELHGPFNFQTSCHVNCQVVLCQLPVVGHWFTALHASSVSLMACLFSLDVGHPRDLHVPTHHIHLYNSPNCLFLVAFHGHVVYIYIPRLASVAQRMVVASIDLTPNPYFLLVSMHPDELPSLPRYLSLLACTGSQYL